MRCYYVLVHGMLDWRTDGDGAFQPDGFYCHRFVFAQDEANAAEIALRRVRSNLDKQQGWLGDNRATLDLVAENIAPAPIYKLLKPDNRGHSFYKED